MRQVVLEAPETVVIYDVDELVPQRGELLVRPEHVGICGSDLLAYHGRHPFISLPVVPGHEVVGIVEALGYGVDDYSLGDRVILEPTIVCGECEYCLSGHYNLCDELYVIGCTGPLPGAMADRFIAPASRFIKTDPRLTRAEAAMVEPLATGVHAIRVSGGVKGKRVAVLGAGTIGLLTMQAARANGASAIVVTDLNEEKRSRALLLGADAAFDPRDPEAIEQMRADLRGHADVVFDCVATQWTMDQAGMLALKGGTIVVEGVPEYDVTIPLPLIQDREIRIQGTAMYTREDMLASMNLIAEKRVEAGSLVTRIFPLEAAAEAFAAADSGTEVKVHIAVEG